MSFVRDVMFPFAAERLAEFINASWGSPELKEVARQVGVDPGVPVATTPGALIESCRAMMARDAKATGLKSLQGMIWDRGFRSGDIRPPLFDDVPSALASWKRAGIGLGIYSSGSVAAQLQFFRHSLAGDMTPLFSSHFDTTIGSKRQAESYGAIARELGRHPETIAFFSDVSGELDAALSAGMRTVFLRRPGNSPDDPGAHPVIDDLGLIEWI
ncbi:MAG: acireductone synthase [Planctomycetes bacterium]|nr:acireductone synthase [Planctomycetota bacterium]